jgi:LysM repeat protein
MKNIANISKISSILFVAVSTLLINGCAGPTYAPVSTRAPSISSIPSNGQAKVFPPSPFGSQAPLPPVANQMPPLQYPQYTQYPSATYPIYQTQYPAQYPQTIPPSQASSNIIAEPVPSGYYRVMPGDTIYKISRDKNIPPKELMEWNALENPNSLQPYQLVRISPSTAVKNTTSNAAVSKVNTINSTNNSSNTASTPSVVKNTQNSVSNTTVNSSQSNLISLAWPSSSKNIIKKFDGKGIDISGRIGDVVDAAGDGTVIFANKMNGYGNLVIISHSEELVTAYAHLQQINVKEKQRVSKGQNIATIGNSGSDQVKLHFEVRKKGEAVDPIAYIK